MKKSNNNYSVIGLTAAASAPCYIARSISYLSPAETKKILQGGIYLFLMAVFILEVASKPFIRGMFISIKTYSIGF